jgi:hypothetical protein
VHRVHVISENTAPAMASLLQDFEQQYAAITGELTHKLAKLRHQSGGVSLCANNKFNWKKKIVFHLPRCFLQLIKRPQYEKPNDALKNAKNW